MTKKIVKTLILIAIVSIITIAIIGWEQTKSIIELFWEIIKGYITMIRTINN